MQVYQDKKRKSRLKLIVILIIMLFLIFVILNLIKIPHKIEQTFTKEVEVYNIQATEQPKELLTEQCYHKNYTWGYAWLGWAELVNDYISPHFFIINYEDRAGEFDVRFAFIDNIEYPFDAIRGRQYEEFKEALPEDAVSMHSEWRTLSLEAKSNLTLTIPTKAPNPDHTYWALADVTEPPPYEICITDTKQITQKQAIPDTREVTGTRIVEESITLWDFLFKK